MVSFQWCFVQAGTSHDLGDNFARAFGTQFLNEAGDLVHPQQSSWGASTRLIGGIIMTHGAHMPHVPHAYHAGCTAESKLQRWASMHRVCKHRVCKVIVISWGALIYCVQDYI